MALVRDIVRFASLAIGMLVGTPALPDDLPEGMLSVKYLLEIENLPPQKGESFCRLYQPCVLGFEFDNVEVTLELGTRTSADMLAVSCEKIDEHCVLVDTQSAPEFRQAGFGNFDVLAWKGGPTFGAGVTRKIGSLVFQVRGPRRAAAPPPIVTRI